MRRSTRQTTPLVYAIVCSALASGTLADEQGRSDAAGKYASMGHSEHGEAFDEGPRQKPWKIDGIGLVHFPITTSVPEVQDWFDQGHTLLHSYWFYEAERAFRWCLKLDPECAMAYWGLYRATPGRNPSVLEPDRKPALDFLAEALKRKHRVTERERLYIEAWESGVSSNAPVGYLPETVTKQAELRRRLEQIVLKYPEDTEAKALLANEYLWTYQVRDSMHRLGNELLLQQVLAANPEHPGAHHYRIHTWDGPEGWMALDSCAAYGKVAWNVGHARHMPGHVYGSQGMWHEAAISMDSATRGEKKYMQERLSLPFNDWNYAHNLNYLCYFLEQLGMPQVALASARQLLVAPLDPKFNNPDDPNTVPPFREGLIATLRTLVHFERWDEILTPGVIPWRDTFFDRLWRSYVEALAHIGKGDLEQAAQRLRRIEELSTPPRKRGAELLRLAELV